MGYSDREIELQIRAQDYTGKTIDDVKRKVLKLRDTLEEQSKAAKSGTADMAKYEAALKDMAAASDQLSSLRKQAASFEKVSSEVAALSVKLTELRTKEAELQNTIAQTGGATKQQESALKRLNGEITSTANKTTKAQAEWDRQRTTMEMLGLSTQNLAKTQESLAAQQRATLTSIINARNAQSELNTVNMQAAQSAKVQADSQRQINEQLRSNLQVWQAQKQAIAAARDEAAKNQYLRQQQALQDKAAAQQYKDSVRQQVEATNQQKQSITQLVNAERQRVAELKGSADAVKNAINPQKQYLSTLRDTAETIVKTRSVYRSTESDIKSLQETYARLEQSQKRLMQIAGGIDGFKLQQVMVQKTKSEYAELFREYQRINAILSSGNGTDKEVASLQRLVVALNKTGAEYAQQKVGLEQIQAELLRAGVATDKLSEAEQRLVNSSKASRVALNQVGAALAKNSEIEERTNKLRASGVNSSRTSLDFFQRLRGQILALTSSYVGLYGAIGLVNKVLQAGKDGYQLKIFTEILADPNSAWATETDALGMEKYFRDTAERMGLRLQDVIKDGGKMFLAARDNGIDSQKAKYTFEQFSGLGQVMGVDAETQKGILNALTQMYSKGKVQAEELRQQLGDRMPQAVALFSKALGVSSAEFEKMLEQGKVTKEIVAAAGVQIEKTYGTQIPKAFHSLNAEQARMQNAFDDWLRLINDEGVGENFKSLIVEITAFLRSDDGKKWAAQLGQAINVVIDGLRWCVHHSDQLVVALGALGSLVAVQAFASLSLGLFNLGKNLTTVAANAVAATKDLATFMGVSTRANAIAATTSEVKALNTGLTAVTPAATGASGALSGLIARFKSLFGMGTGATAGGGLISTLSLILKLASRLAIIVTIADVVIRVIGKLTNSTIEWNDVLEALGDTISVLGSLVSYVFDGIDAVIEGAADAISLIINSIVNLAKSAFSAVFGSSDKAAKGTKNSWLKNLGATEKGFTGFLQVVASTMDGVVAYVKATTRYAGGLLDTMIKKMKFEDASFSDVKFGTILKDTQQEVAATGARAGLDKRINDRKEVKKTEDEEKKGTPTPKLDLNTKDAAADAKAQEKIEKAREKAERAREAAEQAALKRLEKQLDYQKAIEWYYNAATGMMKKEEAAGGYQGYMQKQYDSLKRRFGDNAETGSAGDFKQPAQKDTTSAAIQNTGKQTVTAISKHARSETASTNKAVAAAASATNKSLGASAHACAKYVNDAFRRQGFRMAGDGADVAKNAINSGQGFQQVQYSANYVPQVGDIMSLPRGLGQSGQYGHVAVWNGKNWVSDYVQKLRGNTAATNDASYANIRSGKAVPTIARYTGKNGGMIRDSGKPSDFKYGTGDAKYWQAEKRADKFAANEEDFGERLAGIQKQILEKGTEKAIELMTKNGITLDRLANDANFNVDLQNSLSVEEISKSFNDLILPKIEEEKKETTALLYAQAEKQYGSGAAYDMAKVFAPKLDLIYKEMAQKEFGKVVDERFAAYMAEANNDVAKMDNFGTLAKNKTMNGTYTVDDAKAMLEFNQKITADIQSRIDAIDNFLNSPAAQNLDGSKKAEYQAQREELATKINPDNALSTAKLQADTALEAQTQRINDLLAQKLALEDQLMLRYREGQLTTEEYYRLANEGLGGYDQKLAEAVAKAKQLQVALGGIASATSTLSLETAISKGTDSIGKLNQEQINAKSINDELKNGFTSTFEAGAEAIGQMITGQASLSEGFRGVAIAFGKWAASFLKKIAEMIIQQLLLNALSGLFGGANGTGGLGGLLSRGITGITAGIRHGGGLAGSATTTRNVSPALFANAPRYHTGGIAGLQPNEVPSILKRGEEVITADDPRHRNNGAFGGKEQAVTIINSFNPKEIVSSAMATTEGRKILAAAVGQDRKIFQTVLR